MLASDVLCIDISKHGLEALLFLGILLTFECLLSPDSVMWLPIVFMVNRAMEWQKQ